MGTAVVAASPVVRIVFPPADGRVYVYTLPEPLASDVRRRYAEFAADHAAMGFKHFTFDEWLEQQFATIAGYGDGHPWPEERR